ncbi:MAG: NUDIX hydrolase [Porticoccaceae bacterium]
MSELTQQRQSQTQSPALDQAGSVEGEQPRPRAVRPVDSSTLILVARQRNQAKILMGKRSAKHSFMPNKFVFPGGRVDRCDSRLLPPRDLHPAVMARLTRDCSESRARALGLAAIRETYEETGLILGENATAPIKTRSPQWRQFLQHGINPRLDTLHYIARAITPPYRSRRFDNRFFMAETEGLIDTKDIDALGGSGELLEIHWVSLSEARELELPRITRIVLDEVEKRLLQGHSPEQQGPFSYFRRGKPIRDTV